MGERTDAQMNINPHLTHGIRLGPTMGCGTLKEVDHHVLSPALPRLLQRPANHFPAPQ